MGLRRPRPARNSFAAILPPLAAQSLSAWQQARRIRPAGTALPRLFDFAPEKLPAETLPWVMLHRQRGPSSYIYSLFGEEMVRLYGSGRRGTAPLATAEPAERARRLGVMDRIIDAGRPAWLTGALLLEGKGSIPVGRLALPAQAGRDRALLMIFFLCTALPADRIRLRAGEAFAAPDVLLCPESEIDGEG